MVRVLIQLAVLVLLSVLTAQPAFAAEDSYLRAACTNACAYCTEALFVPNDPCNTDYQKIQQCVNRCITNKPPEIENDANFFAQFCYECHSNAQLCAPKLTQLCGAINTKDLNLVEYFLNKGECPAGSVATSARPGSPFEQVKKCKCPEGTEYDTLHTICLNKKQITANLQKALDFLPDDVLVDIVRQNAPPELRKQLELVMLGLNVKAIFTGSSVGHLMKEYLANTIYTSIVKDTIQLRRIIKELGTENTESLIAALQAAIKEKADTQDQQPPVNGSPHGVSIPSPTIPQKREEQPPAEGGTGITVPDNRPELITVTIEPPGEGRIWCRTDIGDRDLYCPLGQECTVVHFPTGDDKRCVGKLTGTVITAWMCGDDLQCKVFGPNYTCGYLPSLERSWEKRCLNTGSPRADFASLCRPDIPGVCENSPDQCVITNSSSSTGYRVLCIPGAARESEVHTP